MSARYNRQNTMRSGAAKGVAPSGLESAHRHGSSHHRRRSRVTPLLVVLIAVGVFAFVTAGSAFAFTTLINQGRLNLLNLEGSELETEQGAATPDKGKTVVYNGAEYKLKDSVVSICLIGQDKEWRAPEEGFNGQADAIMVLAIDSKTGQATGIAIPRDTMVDINVNYKNTDTLYDTETMQICLSYAYGTDDDSSSQLVCTAASRVLYNIPIDYYYTISMSGLSALADTVGGVALEPLESIPNTNIREGETIKLEGDDAISYIKWRDTSQYGTALTRLERQKQFVKALAAKTITVAKGNPAALLSIFNTLSAYSTTNIGFSEASFLATCMSGETANFDLVSLTGQPVHNDQSQWEQFILDKPATYQTVLDVYYEKVGEAPNSAQQSSQSSSEAAQSQASAGAAQPQGSASAAQPQGSADAAQPQGSADAAQPQAGSASAASQAA